MHPDLFELIDVCAQPRRRPCRARRRPAARRQRSTRSRRSGAKLICFAPALAFAKKLIRSGVDALVIEGMEAGGHIGPVSTSVLAQEILPESPTSCPCSSPAGSAAARRSPAISKWARRASSSARASSARTNRSRIPNFKKAFLRASARDAVASVQIDPRLPVIPVRALKNASTELFTAKQREVAQSLDEGGVAMAEAQLQIEHYWAGALRRAVIDGDVENGSLMAGQSVGMVTKEEPVADIIRMLLDQAAGGIGKPRRLSDSPGRMPQTRPAERPPPPPARSSPASTT